MLPDAAFFISDAHLGAESREREAVRESHLHAFLGSLPGRAASLTIVGDLFDFWFEYGTTIPRRHFHTLCALGRVRAALTLKAQGRRLWIHHGDGLIGGDLGYKVLKKVLRNPLCIGLYRAIHPDLGIPLAGWVSRKSRHSRDQRKLDGDLLVREIARPRFAEGHDAVMIGHFHHAFEHHENGRDFLVLGDWIERFTYAVLEGGQLRLERWPVA